MHWLTSTLVSVFRKFLSSQHDGYTLLGRLEGHSGAINCLSFTRDGTLLASGADDEAVRIWDTETLVCVQIIRDSAQKWGQITCLNWLAGSSDHNGNSLCFGTGRGLIVTFRRNGSTLNMAETGTTKAFMSGDPVEATAFDPVLKKLLVSSHHGVVKMYSLGSNDHLTVLWESTTLFKDEVPRALFLTDKGCNAIILGLEEGSLISCDAQSGAKRWDKTLNTPVASAALCSQERYVAIDNGIEGFDLYNIQRSSPNLIRRIPIAPSRLPAYYSRAVAFAEGARTLLCGTDHGHISVFELKVAKQIQDLIHEQGRLIQAIDVNSPIVTFCTADDMQVATISRKHMIASGVSEGRFDICIWVKPDGGRSRQSTHPRISYLAILNILLTLCVLWATSDSWWKMVTQATETSVVRLLAISGRSFNTPVQPTGSPMPASELATLDAEAVVQLWRHVQAHQLERLRNIHLVPDGQPRSQTQHPVAPVPASQSAPPIVFDDFNEHVSTSQPAAPKTRVKPDERMQSYSVSAGQSRFQAQHSINSGGSRSQAQHSINSGGDHDPPVPASQSAPPIVFNEHVTTSHYGVPRIRDSDIEATSVQEQGHEHRVPDVVGASMSGYGYPFPDVETEINPYLSEGR